MQKSERLTTEPRRHREKIKNSVRRRLRTASVSSWFKMAFQRDALQLMQRIKLTIFVADPEVGIKPVSVSATDTLQPNRRNSNYQGVGVAVAVKVGVGVKVGVNVSVGMVVGTGVPCRKMKGCSQMASS